MREGESACDRQRRPPRARSGAKQEKFGMASGATLKAFQSQYQSLQTLCDTYETHHKQLVTSLERSLGLLRLLKSFATGDPTSAVPGLVSPPDGRGFDRDGRGMQGERIDPRDKRGCSDEPRGFGSLTPGMINRTLKRLWNEAEKCTPERVEQLVDVTKSMQKVKRQAKELESRLRKSTSDAMMSYRLGPIPSIRQCVDGVVEIVDMYTRETKLCEQFAGRKSKWLESVACLLLNDDRDERGTMAAGDGWGDGSGGSDRQQDRDGQGQKSDRNGLAEIRHYPARTDTMETLLDASAQLVDALSCLDCRKVHAAQIETMQIVLATIEV